MAYYIIYDSTQIYIAERAEALTNLYPDYTPLELPADYNSDKYIIVDGELVLNPNYDQEQAERREAEFNKAFFLTSLGYIRRSVTMADGSHKDFLSDLLLSIKAGLEQGLDVKILSYDKPPFDKDVEDWTEYQHVVSATPQFIMECLTQTSNDFLPINNEEE